MSAHPFGRNDQKFYFLYRSGDDGLSWRAHVGRAAIARQQNPERRVDAGMRRIAVHQRTWRGKVSCLLTLGAAVSALFSAPAQPVELERGDFSAALDTTVSYGLTWRLDDRDSRLIGLANGGSAFSVNADDGNFNYGTGVFSNLLRITPELELRYRDFGTFVRVSAFYDFENEDSQRARTPLSQDALDRVGSWLLRSRLAS